MEPPIEQGKYSVTYIIYMFYLRLFYLEFEIKYREVVKKYCIKLNNQQN